MRNLIRLFGAVVIVLALAACDDSKEDILKKAENATTRQELRKAVGDPDEIVKVGPLETWTYQASNGTVTFTLAGDTVTLKVTGAKPR
jgi:hypothetical protein